jgi:hypothetical protein
LLAGGPLGVGACHSPRLLCLLLPLRLARTRAVLTNLTLALLATHRALNPCSGRDR